MKIRKCFKTIFECVLDMIYPKKCIYCGKYISDFRKIAVCPSCEDIKDDPRVIRDDKFHFTEAFGVVKYSDNVRDAMLDYKFKAAKYYSYTFASRMAKQYSRFPYLKDAMICSVPVAKSRERFYNQTDEIAKAFAFLLEKECFSDLLYKAIDIEPLSSMTMEERRFSVRGSVKVNPFYDIRGKDIVVVDDILTSATTANEISKALICRGAKNVYIACACYD